MPDGNQIIKITSIGVIQLNTGGRTLRERRVILTSFNVGQDLIFDYAVWTDLIKMKPQTSARNEA